MFMQSFLIGVSALTCCFWTGVSGNPIASVAMYAHNSVRNNHFNTGYLKWDNALAKDAQAWAEKLGKLGYLKDDDGDFGENLYKFYTTDKDVATVADAVFNWYSEIKDYDFNSPGYSSNTDDFARIVWAATTSVGCGSSQVSEKGTQSVYIVCRYYPKGNIRGQYAWQVNKVRDENRIPTTSADLTP